MTIAIIIGAKGQDGFYLSKLLEQKQYQVVGIDQDLIQAPFNLDLPKEFSIIIPAHVDALINQIQPDEVYYLAAFHQSAQDIYDEGFKTLEISINVHEIALFNFLTAVRKCSPTSRIFYAASSHVFGEPPAEIQDESTPINPINLYGITKASGLFLCRKFRREYDVFASTGILYNHESPRRQENFLSKKIVKGVINALGNNKHRLELGSLEAIADWGYAPDYVKAMDLILQLDRPDDFIVATGIKHTVKEFAEIAYGSVGLNWRDFVIEKKEVIKKRVQPLIGDSTKLRRMTGWRPTLDFSEMIKSMVEEEINNDFRS